MLLRLETVTFHPWEGHACVSPKDKMWPSPTNYFLPRKCFFIFREHSSISECPSGFNFNAINLKFTQIVGHIMVFNLSKFHINSWKIDFIFREHSSVSECPPGLNFNAINLKFTQIVGHIMVFNLWKFEINSSKIDWVILLERYSTITIEYRRVSSEYWDDAHADEFV